MSELKPCRCGGTAKLWASPTGDFIRCDVCGFTISYLCGFDDGLLVEEWNRRAEPENKPHSLETIWETPGRYTNCGEHLAWEWSYCPECGRPTEPAKPLTVEQLSKMDGEPVWIAFIDGSEKDRWEIVRSDWGYTWYRSVWLAYLREPVSK
jgi:hypothetical protein